MFFNLKLAYYIDNLMNDMSDHHLNLDYNSKSSVKYNFEKSRAKDIEKPNVASPSEAALLKKKPQLDELIGESTVGWKENNFTGEPTKKELKRS